MVKIVSALLIALSIFTTTYSQEGQKWDDRRSADWPEQCQLVFIPSSIDKKMQPAYFYSTRNNAPQPLIISLHTWSGGYDQKDPVVAQCIAKDYNYIHPHFRGPNHTFESCGSKLAIQDIDDAISWAIQNGNVDPDNIHVIGVSGGGYATLLSYMKSKYDVRTFSAWVPISNLIEWYRESEGRKNRYGKDIAMATTGLIFEDSAYYIDTIEARNRSPIFMNTPIEKRMHSKLFLYSGIHDGYTGSVPITQTLKFYNKVVNDFDPECIDLIPEADMITMLESRSFYPETGDSLGGRLIHYRKNYMGLVQATIFEGTHEQLSSVALDHIPARRILTIGDSNGAIKNGWVDQLKTVRFNDIIFSTAISGNTIGFDNLGNKNLNALRNINSYLESAEETMHGIDAIVVLLGTNDCKAVFADSISHIPENLSKLIEAIKNHEIYTKYHPQILLLTPPPIANDAMLLPKYKGGSERLNILLPEYRTIANKEDCYFLDIHTLLNHDFNKLTIDGIHLNPEGQKIIAREINKTLQIILKVSQK